MLLKQQRKKERQGDTYMSHYEAFFHLHEPYLEVELKSYILKMKKVVGSIY